MVLLLVDPSSNPERNQGIAQSDQVKLRRRDSSIQYDLSEVPDIDVDRIEQKKVLSNLGEGFNAVKDGGHIHKQQRKNAVEVLNIPEKYIQRGEDQPYPQIEYHKAGYRVNQQDKFPGNRDTIRYHKQKVNYQRNTEID